MRPDQAPQVTLLHPPGTLFATFWAYLNSNVPPLRVCGFGEETMESPVVKRSIVIGGHKTSVSLEDAFWKGLKEIASTRDVTLSEMVSAIDTGRAHGNLSSAIRLFVLDHYRTMIGSVAGTRSSEVEMAAQSPSALRIGG